MIYKITQEFDNGHRLAQEIFNLVPLRSFMHHEEQHLISTEDTTNYSADVPFLEAYWPETPIDNYTTEFIFEILHVKCANETFEDELTKALISNNVPPLKVSFENFFLKVSFVNSLIQPDNSSFDAIHKSLSKQCLFSDSFFLRVVENPVFTRFGALL